MRIDRTQNFLQKCIFLVAALIVVTQVLGQTGITSMLFLMTFPMTVLLWLLSIRKKLQFPDLLILVISALSLVHVLVNALLEGSGWSFNYLRKLIMFIMSLMYLQTVSRTQIDRGTVRFIRRITDLLVIFLLFMFLAGGSRMFLINGMVTGYLTFRFSNPNMTGLLLTCLFILEFSELYDHRGLFRKLVHLVFSIVLFVFILLTQSRNALIVSALFAAAVVWLLWKSPKDLTISKGFAALTSVFPLLFAVVYMTLISNRTIQEWFSFLVDTGKGLDSRVKIWTLALDYVKESPLIGAYSQASNGTGTSQMHNTHVDVLVSYGVVVLILVCIFMYCLVYARGKTYHGKESYVYMLGFMCTTVLGMGEAALFSGGLGIYIFMGVLLLLSNQVPEEQGKPA